jgi:RNA polymerase sigma factor (TIGR02999 family)
MSDVTRILEAVQAGDPQAAARLLPLVYNELRALAAAQMAREKPGQTLEATALVHEAYLRLVGKDSLAGAAGSGFANRRHFFAAAAEAMRRILVESARRKRRVKHGGGMQRRELHNDLSPANEKNDDLVALDTALIKLAARYPLHARLVELRYFTGLTGDEAARMLDISASTADRHWTFARAWLRRELRSNENTKDF